MGVGRVQSVREVRLFASCKTNTAALEQQGGGLGLLSRRPHESQGDK